MNYTTNNETVIPQGVVATSSNNKSKTRNHVRVNIKKKVGISYLFLTDDNVRDIHLFRKKVKQLINNELVLID